MRRHMGTKSVVGLNLKFTRDLKEYVHPSFNFIYTLYDAWSSHNALPFGGNFSEQPNKIIDYFNILDMLKHEAEKKAHAQAKRESNKKAKGR